MGVALPVQEDSLPPFSKNDKPRDGGSPKAYLTARVVLYVRCTLGRTKRKNISVRMCCVVDSKKLVFN